MVFLATIYGYQFHYKSKKQEHGETIFNLSLPCLKQINGITMILLVCLKLNS
jgi:hypothetical protein